MVWVRSYWICDSIERNEGYGAHLGNDFREIELDSQHGIISVQDFVHIQGHGPFSGGAFNKPDGVTYAFEHFPATAPVFTLKYVRGYLGIDEHSGEYHIVGFSLVFRSQNGQSGFEARTIIVAVPWAAIALSTALVPGFWIHRRWRRYRRTASVKLPCPTCSYSLVGNTSGVCPECGTAVATL